MLTTINTLLSPLENGIRKYRKYIGYFFLFLAFCSVGFLFDPRSIKNSGGLASTMLWIILWMPIFARVFGIRIFAQMLPLRREIGILMGTLAVVHGFSFIIPNQTLLANPTMWWTDGGPTFLFFGSLAMWLSIPLTLTSSVWAMRKLGKYWKMLHRVVYVIALFVIFHIALIRGYKYMDFGPIIFFVIYLAFKVLEWRGFTFAKKENKVYPKGQKWLCIPCGYIYDPLIGDEDSGIAPGTEFSDIPENWRCIVCGVSKGDFIPYVEGLEQKTIEATVVSKEYLNSSTIELVIETGTRLDSQVGQFVSFVWEDSDGKFVRQYSIAKQDQRRFTFLIKISKTGRGSQILSQIKSGATLNIKGVFGTFILQNTPNPKIFIATGTGLAPIYHMINSLQDSIQKSLYFTVSTQAELFYVETLRQIPNLDLHIHTTREKVEGYEFGRVDVTNILATPDTEWYLCGNPRMVSEAKEKLVTRSMEKIYSEEF